MHSSWILKKSSMSSCCHSAIQPADHARAAVNDRAGRTLAYMLVKQQTQPFPLEGRFQGSACSLRVKAVIAHSQTWLICPQEKNKGKVILLHLPNRRQHGDGI